MTSKGDPDPSKTGSKGDSRYRDPRSFAYHRPGAGCHERSRKAKRRQTRQRTQQALRRGHEEDL